jgi:hypothetical protein
MKRTTKGKLKRIISMILAIIFVTSVVQVPDIQRYDGGSKKVYAATKLSDKKIKKLYNNLSSKGKKYFNTVLQKDDALYKYHRKHVNKKYKRAAFSTQSVAVLDELGRLNSDLSALNIPCAVRYALMAIASGMSAGAVDGPLPVADIVGIVVALGGVAVLAYNWPKIEKKWPKIVKAFQKCFKRMKSKVTKAFGKIKIKVQNVYYSRTFNRFEKHYSDHAHEFKDLPGGNGKKPNRNKYYNKARRFKKARGRDIIEGENAGHSDRMAKFNKKTLEYLVYEKETGKIISYYLPKHSAYNARHYAEWARKALDYALRRIR